MQDVTLLGEAIDHAEESSQRKLETLVDGSKFYDQQEMDLVENSNYPYKILTKLEDCDADDDYNLPVGEECSIPCTTPDVTLFGKFGLHSYNSYKGTNLEFKCVTDANLAVVSLLSYYLTLEARDPDNNSPVAVETCVWHASPKSKEKLRLVTVYCCIKESGEVSSLWDQNGVNELYRGVMPKWLDDGALTGIEKLQYYEVKESELQENDEWLNLYAQVVAYSEWNIDMVGHFPLKIEKVVVQTMEDFVEPSVNKLKSRNAIFYISFKTCGGLKCRGIIRQTIDGGPHHICLEVDCEIDK